MTGPPDRRAALSREGGKPGVFTFRHLVPVMAKSEHTWLGKV